MNLEYYVRDIAGRFADLRRYRAVVEFLNRPSLESDMLNDWLDASAHVATIIMEGHVDFAQIDVDSYRLLEDIWFKRVKQGKAYQISRKEDQGSPEANYDRASQDFRRLLLEGERAEPEDFERVKGYLETRYLNQTPLMDEEKKTTRELIEKKAHRIWQSRGSAADDDIKANQARARLYVSMYYENIIAAAEGSEEATSMVLRAFEFSKCKENRYLIINSFETAIAIYFLDRKVIAKVLANPENYDFSMVPVDGWPDVPLGICGNRFTYDAVGKQVTFKGRMTEHEKITLSETFPGQTEAIANLYNQSHPQVPLKDQIL
jgi:hypothetical protein